LSATQEEAKRIVGEQVADWIESGMTLGLGTGSTAARAIEALGNRIASGHVADIRGVATSFASERLARQYHIPVVTLDEIDRIDLAFDGADEVDPELNLIKGRGAAQTREKIVESQADRFVVLVDESKLVQRLGSRMPLPVEIVPMAARPVMDVIRSLGAVPEIRMGQQKDGPIVSDQGLWIIDALFDGIDDLLHVNQTLLSTPGVLDHGLFLNMATDLLIGRPDGSVEHRTHARS
jgi:ribose 5-phosphate isomerase A